MGRALYQFVIFFHEPRTIWTKEVPDQITYDIMVVNGDIYHRRNAYRERQVSFVQATGHISALRRRGVKSKITSSSGDMTHQRWIRQGLCIENEKLPNKRKKYYRHIKWNEDGVKKEATVIKLERV